MVTVSVYVSDPPAGAGSGVSSLVMDRLATGVTEVVTLLELLLALGSADDDALTMAVLVMFVPAGRFALMATTSVNRAVAPLARVAIEHATGAFAPAGGAKQSKVGPFVWANETSVVLAGTSSVSVTSVAVPPPPLATSMV